MVELFKHVKGFRGREIELASTLKGMLPTYIPAVTNCFGLDAILKVTPPLPTVPSPSFHFRPHPILGSRA